MGQCIPGPISESIVMSTVAHQLESIRRSAGQRSLKILLWTNAFDPSVGGLEAMAMMLAEEFATGGHQVTVVTRTKAPSFHENSFPFKVVRQPSWLQLVRLIRQCDVYLQNHPSLKTAWPLLVIRRPWVVGVHNWISRAGLRGTLQHFFLKYSRNVCCSGAIAGTLEAPSVVVHSAYDDSTFKKAAHAVRQRELVFVGRLIRDKGVHVILQALCQLRDYGLRPMLTVIGTGPEEAVLRDLAERAGLTGQVEFVGKKMGKELVDLLNVHQILVVPSVWQEPFGIVALEGIACGCLVIGSEGGGLKDAIGPCGITFPNGNSVALADCVSRILREPWNYQQYRAAATEHLARHTKRAVASSYLDVIQAAI
jgi:glycogen synthase